MEFKCGIFDMDGTLIDSMPMWRKLGFHILLSRGIEPRPEFAEDFKSLTLHEAALYCKEHYGLQESEEEILSDCWGEVEHFYRQEAAPLPGLVEYLKKLKAQGVKTYVATATDRDKTEIALEATGLAAYFDGILTCPEVGIGKSSPKIFEEALALSGCAKEDAVIFEDSLYAIRTAKAAGFRVIGVHDPRIVEDQAKVQALVDQYIHTYEEL